MVLGLSPSSLTLGLFLASVPGGAAEEGPRARIPMAYVGESNGVLDSLLSWPSPGWLLVAVWGMDQRMEDLYPLFFCHSAF